MSDTTFAPSQAEGGKKVPGYDVLAGPYVAGQARGNPGGLGPGPANPGQKGSGTRVPDHFFTTLPALRVPTLSAGPLQCSNKYS